MNKILKALVVGSLFTVVGSNLVFAAGTSDPVVGTWNLNLAKSKFTPGPAPKSATRSYTQTADETALTYSQVNADGTTASGESKFKFDGKDYAITGSPDYDMLSLSRVNAMTVKSRQKRNGKVVGTTIRTVSAGGRVLMLDSTRKDAKGMKHHDVQVFDKQ